jgi:hypothetical protein
MNNKVRVCFFCNTELTELKQKLCPPCTIKNEERRKELEMKKLGEAKSIVNTFPEIDKINEKVYLGNYDGQKQREFLKSEGITHIIVCAIGLFRLFPEDFTYLYLPLEDSVSEKITSYFEETFNFIESSQKVYVHCQAGISRSASIVIAYFIRKYLISVDQAFALVAQKRPCIYPNLGFQKQLGEYSNSVLNSFSNKNI